MLQWCLQLSPMIGGSRHEDLDATLAAGGPSTVIRPAGTSVICGEIANNGGFLRLVFHDFECEVVLALIVWEGDAHRMRLSTEPCGPYLGALVTNRTGDQSLRE